MSNKNKFLEKKYTKLKVKNTLLYFYLPAIKANEIRKLRRHCALNHIRLIFLPSLFAFTSIKASHGPSMGCAVTAENLSFPELVFANTYSVSSFSLKSKYNLHPLKDEKYEHSKSGATKVVSIFQCHLKRLSEVVKNSLV